MFSQQFVIFLSVPKTFADVSDPFQQLVHLKISPLDHLLGTMQIAMIFFVRLKV